MFSIGHYLKKTSSMLLLGVVVHTAAYQQPQPQFARRAFMVQTAGSAAAAAAVVCVCAAACLTTPAAAQAATTTMEACPKGSSNCIRTTWTAPAGTSRADVAKTLTAVLESYPQQGQADVDKSGWTVVSNDLADTASGTAALEFKSGIGNFAKYFNGGKPFVDDLKLQIDNADANAVQVRSSSRVGDSDFNVNQKRLQYLANALKEKGWDAPDPKY